MTLSERFASSQRIPPGEVETALLLEAIPSPGRLGVLLLRLHRKPTAIQPDPLKPDRLLVRQCLLAESTRDVCREVEGFHYRELSRIPRWRRNLGMRVSGSRLIAIASDLFRQ